MTLRTPSDLAPLMEAVLDSIGHIGVGVVIVADRNGVFERWYTNEAAAAMLGYTLDELNAIPPIDIIAPEQRPLVLQLASSHRAGQPPPPAIELRSLHKNGNHVTLEYSIGVTRLDGMVAYSLVVRDLAQSASELTLLEADRIGLVGALSAGFAHEINNPLTSVMLNLRSLRKHLGPQPETSQALRCIDDITTGAERIASNVRALQTLATRSASQEIDLAAVVSASLRLAAPTLEPCAHVIRQIFPVRPVLGEESRIGQAVLAMMLFSSSGFDQATSTHNRIVVAVEERGGDVIVEVSDNGRELSGEETRRAFDPFFRSPSRGAGVGVGLGVARSVAATLGGEVTLAARPGGGAVITMRLPAAEPRPPG
jgi:PAS domain S-box-containing protein